MALLFYDYEFNLLCAQTEISQLRWTLYYNDIGTFEAHLPLNSEAAKVIFENKYVVVKEGGKSAVITGYELNSEAVIYGRSCNWLMTKRILEASNAVTENVEILCSEYVSGVFTDVGCFEILSPDAADDKISIESFGEETLFERVKRILDMKSLGHCIDFDTTDKKWRFRILKGEPRPLLISESNKNAYNTRLSGDVLDLATCGFRKNQGTGERTEVKRENKTGIYRWETKLSATDETEADAELSNCSENRMITLNTKGIHFGTEYGLGDTVRVQITKGDIRTTLTKRIVGTELRITNGVRYEQPVFEE